MSVSTIIHDDNIRIADSPEGLSDIRMPGVNLAVWSRRAVDACQGAIGALLGAGETAELDLDPAENPALEHAVAQLLGRRADPASAQALSEDIWMLVGLFCGIADTAHARVRLERIEDSGCKLFHADNLRLRMLCTYAGPGTEWLENDNVRYGELGLGCRSIEESNRAIVIDDTKIRQIAPWHVAVFSGRLREDTLPLIHRSAPVETTNEHRIRLCIDLPDSCGC